MRMDASTATAPTPPDADLDTLTAWFRCSLRLADVIGKRGLESMRGRNPDDCDHNPFLEEAYSLYSAIEGRTRTLTCGPHPEACEALAHHGRFRLQAHTALAILHGRLVVRAEVEEAMVLMNKAKSLAIETHSQAFPARALLPISVNKGPESFNLPCGRRLSLIQSEIGSLAIQMARLCKEDTSKVEMERSCKV